MKVPETVSLPEKLSESQFSQGDHIVILQAETMEFNPETAGLLQC